MQKIRWLDKLIDELAKGKKDGEDTENGGVTDVRTGSCSDWVFRWQPMI